MQILAEGEVESQRRSQYPMGSPRAEITLQTCAKCGERFRPLHFCPVLSLEVGLLEG